MKRVLLVVGRLVTVIFLTALPVNSVGQQSVILQRSPVQIDKGQIEQQQGQPVQQQQKVIKQPPQVHQPTKIDQRRLEQLEVQPQVIIPPPTDSSPYEQRLPEYMPVQETQEGLGQGGAQQNIPQPPDTSNQVPIYRDVNLPAEEEPSGALGGQSSPGHPAASCFIATAAYGSPLATEIIVLQEFRDTHLLANPLGRKMVAFYYTYSPPVAGVIARHEILRLITRAFLWPLVFCLRYTMPAAVFVLLAGVLLGVLVSRRRYGWL